MKTITLTIKGSRFEAERSALDHGIPFIFKDEFRNETTGLAPVESIIDIGRWFNETKNPPFANGTLLYYHFN